MEFFKLLSCVLIINGYNSHFEMSGLVSEALGKLKFSILVQEFVSLGLFIPIFFYGRFFVNFFDLNASHEFRREFKKYFDKKRGLNGGVRHLLEIFQDDD